MPEPEADPGATPSRVPWPPLLIAGLVVVAVTLGRWRPLEWPGVDDTIARVIGIGLGVAGVALLVWAIVTLRRHGTTVLPDAAATTLVTSGPFHYRRNPIYLADALIFLGVAELTKNVWFAVAALAFVLLVTWLAILPEERHLERRFGKDYLDYKARTRRW
jgi:protein-S-isoprenylcysteine O-methyltransferase Ste14